MQVRGVATGPGNPRTVETKYGKKDLIELQLLEDTVSDPVVLTIWSPPAELAKLLADAKRGQAVTFLVKGLSMFNGKAILEPVDGSVKIT